MQFATTFLPADFSQNKLKVLSLVKLLVQIKNNDDKIIEEFETVPSEKVYKINSELIPTTRVEVTVVPGEVIEFYPVVTAL
ncbi:hypothetical protein A5821_000493 [Enterococcus sp. 7F3_DIV0205]|uniref:Uncharacterized protein n=1 Tax=Candidatus Enterococcus palustris TaxID=1834189 RepID=A0AAQ3W5Y0_9ENTE|nr:hypothetical protein [Enterococcus sp. 7F3_DIV0205]OTN84906.1 hypothetical protein A5821_000835 [Enterococcus sp. 7F3_DIV0205]